MAHRRHHRDEYTIPWWKREYGGAPVWMLLAVIVVIAGIAAYVFAVRG